MSRWVPVLNGVAYQNDPAYEEVANKESAHVL